MCSLRGFWVADLKMYAFEVEHLTLCMGTWHAVSTAKTLTVEGAEALSACTCTDCLREVLDHHLC